MSGHSTSDDVLKIGGSNPEQVSKTEDSRNSAPKEYAYVWGGARDTATFFNFNGVRVLEGGVTTKNGEYEDILNEMTAIILSAPTLENLGSTVALFEKDRELPVLSHVGPLDKIVKGRSGALFKPIQDANSKLTLHMPVFDVKYPAHIIYQSMKKGTLSMYVLAGTRKDGELIANAMSAGKEEEVNKHASDNGVVAVLLWRPSVANKPIVRVLLSGSSSSHRIQESLDKASKFLPFLNAPTIKSSDAFKAIPAPMMARTSNIRSVQNALAAKPPRPTTNAARSRPTPPLNVRPPKPPLDGSARALSKPPTAPFKARKPPVPTRPVVTRPSAPLKGNATVALNKTSSTRTGAPLSRPNSAQGNTVRKTSTQPIAARPTRPNVPAIKKSSGPQTKAQEVSPKKVAEIARTAEPNTEVDTSIDEVASDTAQNTDSKQLCETIVLSSEDDTTLKSHNQSSINSSQTIENGDASVMEIIQSVRMHTSPTNLGDMDVSVVTKADSEVVIKTESSPINSTAPGDMTKLSEGLQNMDINDKVNDLAQNLVNQSVTQGMRSAAHQIVMEGADKLGLGVSEKAYIDDFSHVLVKEEKWDLLKNILYGKKLFDGIQKFDLAEDMKTVHDAIQGLAEDMKTVHDVIQGALDTVTREIADANSVSNLIPQTETEVLGQAHVAQCDSLRISTGSVSTAGDQAFVDKEGENTSNAETEPKTHQKGDQNDEAARSSSFNHHVLGMQTERKAAPAFKPVKFARPYYFDFVKTPRDDNSNVDANIQEFVSMVRSKYLVLSSENITESQLEAVINGKGLWRESGPCTIIPTQISDTLNNFIAQKQPQLSDVHLSFEAPLNGQRLSEDTVGETIEIYKRQISFD